MLALLLLATLDTPQAHDWYAWLLTQAGHGYRQQERAAFLIHEDDGTLTLQPWSGGGFRHASFRGTIPRGTIAILHTHPREEPDPSAGDRAEARRLGIPVVVITPGRAQAALADGSAWRTDFPSAARTPGRASGTSRGPSVQRTSLPR